ncbi:MAG: hypothetical protein IT548_03480 [Alphaproteobacteria bacterium]|nr:hypothetical protein [Alphaproteobacteria bacterium]
MPMILRMSRSALVEAFTTLGTFVPKDTGIPVRMSHRDGLLTLASLAAEADIPADGDWPKRLRLTLYNAAAYAEKLPPDDPVTMTFDGAHIAIGPTLIRAAIDADDVEPAPLTVGMDTLDLLTAISRYGRARVVASAGVRLVENAEYELESAVEEAAPHFEKIGIARRDLMAAMRAWFRERVKAGR